MSRPRLPVDLFSGGAGLAAILALTALGCDEESGAGRPDGGDSSVEAGTDGPGGGSPLPALDDLLEGAWHELVPGGDTGCSDGSEFRFYVYRGSSHELAVDFFGGGACWSENTCRLVDGQEPIYAPTVGPAKAAYFIASNGGDLPGIWDHADARNPIGDFTHVVVPYCTGDIHFGARTHTYGEGDTAFDIDHVGARNARAVLDWVKENVTAPETVLSTGCSAGAYGAIMWGAHLIHAYPDARNVVFADSGAGVITESFFTDFLPNWGVESSYPTWIEDFELAGTDALVTAYTRIANESPDAIITQYHSTEDSIQSFFFAAMGGEEADWSGRMTAQLADISAAAPNFRYYLTNGGDDASDHCVIDKDDFYEETAPGIDQTAAAWLGELLDSGKALGDIENRACTGCTE